MNQCRSPVCGVESSTAAAVALCECSTLSSHQASAAPVKLPTFSWAAADGRPTEPNNWTHTARRLTAGWLARSLGVAITHRGHRLTGGRHRTDRITWRDDRLQHAMLPAPSPRGREAEEREGRLLCSPDAIMAPLRAISTPAAVGSGRREALRSESTVSLSAWYVQCGPGGRTGGWAGGASETGKRTWCCAMYHAHTHMTRAMRGSLQLRATLASALLLLSLLTHCTVLYASCVTPWRILLCPRPLCGGIKRWCCLTSVCLSRTSGLSREQKGTGRLKFAQR